MMVLVPTLMCHQCGIQIGLGLQPVLWILRDDMCSKMCLPLAWCCCWMMREVVCAVWVGVLYAPFSLSGMYVLGLACERQVWTWFCHSLAVLASGSASRGCSLRSGALPCLAELPIVPPWQKDFFPQTTVLSLSWPWKAASRCNPNLSFCSSCGAFKKMVLCNPCVYVNGAKQCFLTGDTHNHC